MNTLSSLRRFPAGLRSGFILGSLSVLTWLLAGCGAKEEAPTVGAVRPVKILELSDGTMRRMLEVPGQIQPLREASMAFEVPGLVQEILVDEGSLVKVGDVLARLDDRDYRAVLDGAKAQLVSARSEAARAQALFDRQATSQQRLDVARANLQIAQSAFERAEKALQDTELRAPLDGVVARVMVEDIVNVQAKQVIMIVHDTSRFKIVVDVPETVAILIDPSLPNEERNALFSSTVFMTTGTQEGFPAEVLETAKMANPKTRTFAVTLAFDPPQNINILPGMTARLQVDATALTPAGSAERFAVPSHAVGADSDGQSFVWRIDPVTMETSEVVVTTGRMSGEHVEITAASLSPGDLIAISGLLHLREGSEVRRFEP